MVAVAIFACVASAESDPQLRPMIDDLVTANHILYQEGVLDGMGHVSVRSPFNRNHFFIARSMAPALVQASDIVELDLDGNAVAPTNVPLYLERYIHAEIYKRRPDVNSVIHSHSPAVIPFGTSTVQLRPLTQSTAFLYKGAPVFDIATLFGPTDLLVKDSAKGKALAETLGDSSVALLRGHGDVVVAADLRAAVYRAIYTAEDAKLQLRAMELGGPITFLGADEAALMEACRAADKPGAEAGFERSWQMWAKLSQPTQSAVDPELQGRAQSSQELQQLIDDLVTANHILYHQGIVDAFGHVSVRDPGHADHFLMSQAKAPSRVTKYDIVEFDSHASPVHAAATVPLYAERFIHAEMYNKRKDVNAVVHSHSSNVIPFSVTQTRLQPLFHDASFLYSGVPVFDAHTQFGATDLRVDSSAKGRALADSLGDSCVALMRGHGDVVVAPNLKAAVSRAYYTAENAELQWQAARIGGPIKYISRDEGIQRDLGQGPQQVQARGWAVWKQAVESEK
jgi:HCOMODA/2-hydroxy-3-carboxy-muconic semialdehyde decarboxylase